MFRILVHWLCHGEGMEHRLHALQHSTVRLLHARAKLAESNKRLQRALDLALEDDRNFKEVAHVISREKPDRPLTTGNGKTRGKGRK